MYLCSPAGRRLTARTDEALMPAAPLYSILTAFGPKNCDKYCEAPAL